MKEIESVCVCVHACCGCVSARVGGIWHDSKSLMPSIILNYIFWDLNLIDRIKDEMQVSKVGGFCF